MQEYETTVGRRLQIDLHHLGPSPDPDLDGLQGILRGQARGTPMTDDDGRPGWNEEPGGLDIKTTIWDHKRILLAQGGAVSVAGAKTAQPAAEKEGGAEDGTGVEDSRSAPDPWVSDSATG